MPQIKLNIDKAVFNDEYLRHAMNNDRRIQIYFGGSSSGKSHAVVGQRVVLDMLKGERNYLICRKVSATIKQSVWLEVLGAMDFFKVSHLFNVNGQSGVIDCLINNRQAIFKGLDDVQKVKSVRAKHGPITDIIVEESTELDSYRTYKELLKRQRGMSNVPKRLTFIFNPIYMTHWLYKEFFQGFWKDGADNFQADDRLSILKTTYKNNKFLSPEDIADLESEDDKYYYNVYTLGNWGVLGNLIFDNWRTEDLTDLIPTFDNIYYGQDWGFEPDPFAFVKFSVDERKKKLYLFDEICVNGLTDDETIPLVQEKYTGENFIIADSSEPKSIKYFQSNGIKKIRGAKKGAGSIESGIKWLKNFEIIIHKDCVNAQNEFSMYKYKETKDGEVLPIPVDKNNHLIDALRYGCENARSTSKWGW